MENNIKQTQIKHFASVITTTLSIGIFLTLFFVFSINILWSKYLYQTKVINDQNAALVNLNRDIRVSKNLTTSFKKFISPPINIIGGNSKNANSVKGGDNSKIVLDALPSSYDFPELVSTLQNLLTSQGVTINSISGVDQSSATLNQLNGINTIPFQVSVSGNYTSIENLINAMEKSIRPINILKISISGDQTNLNVTISGETYYQPAINFRILKETVN